MKESQIPEISQSGNYEAKNCVLEEVQGLYVASITDVNLNVSYCTFYKCTNIESGGGIYFNCENSFINCINSCFVANYLPTTFPCGYAIRIENGLSSYKGISTIKHESSAYDTRDTLSICKPCSINEWNCSDNHLYYRSFLFLGVDEYDESTIIFSTAINNSDLDKHLTHINSPNFHLKNLNIIENKVFLIFELIAASSCSFINCLFIKNIANSIVSGKTIFYDCIFDRLAGFSGDIQFERISTFSQNFANFFSTYFCPQSKLLKHINNTCQHNLSSYRVVILVFLIILL